MRMEAITFKCEENRLFGELYIPDTTPAPGIIVCHGMNKYGFHVIRLYRKFAEEASRNGFVSLIFDFRGCGKSTGEFGYGIDEQKDVKCAINYLASRREVDSEKIFVIGHSLGGAITLYAVNGDKRIKGVILWSSPANHADNIRKFISLRSGRLGYYLFLLVSYLDGLFAPKLFRMNVYGISIRPSLVRKKLMKLNECRAISKLKIPVLIVIGSKDEIVSVEEAKQVFTAANEPKKFVIIDGADHIYDGKEAEVIFETLNWLKTIN